MSLSRTETLTKRRIRDIINLKIEFGRIIIPQPCLYYTKLNFEFRCKKVHGGSLKVKPYERRYIVEFKDFFSIMKNRLSAGYDIPHFFRDLFAMITDVPEDKWGTPLDPASKKIKDETIKNYVKRTIPKKFAQQIVYHLSKDNFIESINSREKDLLELLADDFKIYDAAADAQNIAEKTANWFVEIIRNAAGQVSKSEIEQKQQHGLAIELKEKYGLYLLHETNHCCPMPGCGRTLTKSANGKTFDSYEVTLIDKKKTPEIDNLLALCPNCYATYILDDNPKLCKELQNIKKILVLHSQSVSLLDDLPLEKGISGVIGKVAKLKEKDLVNASLDPKEIRQKIDSSENYVLYNTVTNYVSTYFIKIQDIMINADKRGQIDYDEVQNQMRAIYKRLKKAKKSNVEIFNEIAEKIHKVSLQEEIYCQIIVSYFIQKCEVFDAITE